MLTRLKNGHWPLFIMGSLSSVLNLFLPIILVRILNPHDMGIYKIFFLHLSSLPFFVMAGSALNSVYYWAGKSEAEKYNFIQSAWQLNLMLSSLIICLGIPVAFFFPSYFNLEVKYLLLLLITGFAWTPGSHYIESAIACGNTFKGSRIDTVYEFLKTSLMIIIAWKYQNIFYVILTFAFLFSIKLIHLTALGFKYNYISLKFDSKKVKEVFRYCWPIGLMGILSFIIDKVDMLILANQISESEFAFYSMGCLAIPPLFMLEMSVQKVFIPQLSKLFAENDLNKSKVIYHKAISDIGYLIIPAVFGLILFAKPITELLYTSAYFESSKYLKIYALSYLLFLIPHDSAIRASGHTKTILMINLITTPFSLFFVYFIAKNYTAYHALIASISIKFLPKIIGFYMTQNLLKTPCFLLIPWRKILEFSMFSMILTIISIMAKSLFNSQLNWFLVCSPIFAAIYLGFYMFFKKGKKLA
jgi:O-antigen/teichoic acid export membrane protein